MIGVRIDSSLNNVLEQFEQDPDSGVKMEVATAKCARGQADELVPLLKAATSDGPSSRSEALFCLGRLSRPEGVSVVKNGFADKSPAVRMAALLAAIFLNEAKLHKPFTALLDDSKPRVRQQAEAVQLLVTGGHGVKLSAPDMPRLFRGRPAQLKDYLELLVDPVLGIYASGQLTSATGSDCGFHPGRDMIANLRAIEDWRKMLDRTGGEWTPGRWYYQGADITPQ
jgi:HEAT repeat protein